ncbi:MAG: hypothetical protein ACREUQ_03335 [Burkholderiales bacterium]
MSNGFRFDEAAHIYRIGDRVLPHVTEVLKEAGLVKVWNEDDQAARDRGASVHLACAYFDEGDLDWESVPSEHDGYIEAWRKFQQESGFLVQQIEKPVCDETYGWAGRLDRTGITRAGAKAVLEIKTGAIQPFTALQLVAYGEMLFGHAVERFAVQLKPDGAYTTQYYPISEWRADLRTFHSCCRVAAWKKEHGL